MAVPPRLRAGCTPPILLLCTSIPRNPFSFPPISSPSSLLLSLSLSRLLSFSFPLFSSSTVFYRVLLSVVSRVCTHPARASAVGSGYDTTTATISSTSASSSSSSSSVGGGSLQSVCPSLWQRCSCREQLRRIVASRKIVIVHCWASIAHRSSVKSIVRATLTVVRRQYQGEANRRKLGRCWPSESDSWVFEEYVAARRVSATISQSLSLEIEEEQV